MVTDTSKKDKSNQSARQFARGNLSPLRKGIEKQLLGLRKNVSTLVINDNIARSKAIGTLMVKQ